MAACILSMVEESNPTTKINGCSRRPHLKKKSGMPLQEDLPPEIIAKIFMHCLDGKRVMIQPQIPPSEPPWSLSTVCSRWRSVAHGCQQLWTDVWISPWMRITDENIQKVLSRSGNLSISLEGGWDIVQNLTPESRMRVRSLRVRNADILVFMRLVLFTRLESLYLHFTPYTIPPSPLSQPQFPPTLRVFHVTSTSPKLVTLRFLGLGPESSLWTDLTDISITSGACIRTSEVWEILPRCHELVKCKIMLKRDNDEAIWHKSPILIPKLQSLSVDPDLHTLGRLLNSLTLPSLTDLEICGDDAYPWPQDEILDFIGRSQCRVTRFTTGENQVPLAGVLALMRTMRDLVTFDVDVEEPASHDFFDSIQSEDLVPALEDLSIEMGSIKSALEFFKSRWLKGPGQGIRRGTVILKDKILKDDGEKAALEELKGMAVKMHTEIAVQLI